MALTKHLGRIDHVHFGLGGYQESMLGLHICFSFDHSSGICATKSTWDYATINHTQNCKWTEQSRMDKYADIMRFISNTLNLAKVRSIGDLRNIPVEVRLDGNNLYDWRILTEVL